MTTTFRQDTLDGYRDSFALAQREFGNQIQTDSGDISAITQGNGLDVLRGAPADSLGFRPVEVDIRDYLSTPQILGRVMLLQNPRESVMNPVVIVPSPHKADMVRVSSLRQPFVPWVGLTSGLHFGLSVEAQTQAPGFGGHGGAGGFEAGHIGVVLTTAKSQANAENLITNGDQASHIILAGGLPTELHGLGMTDQVPQSITKELDVRRFAAGQRLALYWHDKLETEQGAALADYDGTLQLLLGAAVSAIGQRGLDQAGQYVEQAVRGAR